MAKERDADRQHKQREDDDDDVSKSRRRKSDESSQSGGEDVARRRERKRKRSSKPRTRKLRSSDEDEREDSYSSDSESERSSEVSSGEESDESERSRRKRKEKDKTRREREREKEKERRRRKKKEKKRKREKEEEKRRKQKKKMKESVNKGAVTNSWGKYGIIRETDMWNKRPEFTAWLLEVKKVNLESLPNWEEKQMFKEFMEDHNTATFTNKKYYDLDAYHRRKMEKEVKKGIKKIESERTVFNDEEQRRLELLQEREKQKEEEVEALMRSMQGGMAQAMKEQARLKEDMAYQYKIGNFEAAAAIQRRLDPDLPM
ncbi:hypothetical protein QQ045_027451 [Rhodiola kirilowii]